jgi:hypothetical protein
MLLGVIAPQVRPDGTTSVSETVPEKPLRAVNVMVEMDDWPARTGTGWDAEIEKSETASTVTAIIAEWEREPLVPVTLTL